MRITTVGTDYVGLSNAMLLAQNNEAVAIDIFSAKAYMLTPRRSPIEDADIEGQLANKPSTSGPC